MLELIHKTTSYLEQQMAHFFYKKGAFFLRRTQANYSNVKRRILNSSTPLKVLFLVSENSKWQYQSLYEELEKNSRFSPLILVSPTLVDLKKPIADQDKKLKSNYEFFQSRNMNVEFAFNFKTRKLIPLKHFTPDLIFYQEPWALDFKQHPIITSKFALTYYFPYASQVIYFDGIYTSKFHRFLYKMYVEHNDHILAYKKLFPKFYSHNCVAVGNPKLDVYLLNKHPDPTLYWKDKNKYKIIYAPHHSFEKDMLATATFKWSGKIITDFAVKNADLCQWVFKPHPLFRNALIKNNIMTPTEVENYYNLWESIGSVYDKGDYFDLFKTSNLLITDCISFLGEYAPTLQPVIHLKNRDDLFNEFGHKIINTYYSVENKEQLHLILNKICINRIDDKKTIREQKIQKIFNLNQKISTKILNIISKELLID